MVDAQAAPTGGGGDRDALTSTALFYLFATVWLADDGDTGHKAQVPGGKVPERTAYANLLHCALWELARRGLVELELVKRAEPHPVVVLGGSSNVRVHVRDTTTALPGLEGRLLDAARAVGPPSGWIDERLEELSGEHHLGVRNVYAELGRPYSGPWSAVTSPCYQELAAKGLVTLKGRMIQRIRIIDAAGVAALRPRFDEVRAERSEVVAHEPELVHAVIDDGLVAHLTHHNPRGGDSL